MTSSNSHSTTDAAVAVLGEFSRQAVRDPRMALRATRVGETRVQFDGAALTDAEVDASQRPPLLIVHWGDGDREIGVAFEVGSLFAGRDLTVSEAPEIAGAFLSELASGILSGEWSRDAHRQDDGSWWFTPHDD